MRPPPKGLAAHAAGPSSAGDAAWKGGASGLSATADLPLSTGWIRVSGSFRGRYVGAKWERAVSRCERLIRRARLAGHGRRRARSATRLFPFGVAFAAYPPLPAVLDGYEWGGRTLSAGVICRRTRNRHGPGESDCLIKTKHCESPTEGYYAM